MNKLIIYIEVHENPPMNFGNNIIAYLREHNKNNTLLDLDNFSSQDLFSHTLNACLQENEITLIIHPKSQKTALGSVLNFINKLLRTPSVSVDAILLEEHQILQKMLCRMHSFYRMSEIEFLQSEKHKKTPLNK